MTIKEFIRDLYPIKDRVRDLKVDPIKRIQEQDDLPCDAIMSIDGVMQKVVYVSDDYYVPVVELLSYYQDEVRNMRDKDFQIAYFAYLDNVEISNITIEDIMSASHDYRKKKERQKELLDKCM